jgi:glycosyltransferase involved in cell wall biosynthesis
LPRALESVFSQTRADLCDIVVVDDGSTDNTAAVAARYASRITYLRQPNRGAGAARNAAIRAIRNEFVAFLDSDDWWEPDKIELQVATLRDWPQAGFIVGRTIGHYPDGRQWTPRLPDIPFNRPVDLAPLLMRRAFIHTPAVLVRRSLLVCSGLFRTCLRRAQDFDLWVRLACRAPAVFLDHLVANFALQAPESLSGDPASQILCTVRSLYLLRAELRHRPDCRAAWRASMVHYVNLLRDRAYRAGRYADAVRWSLLSLARQPRNRALWEWGRCLHALWRAVCGVGPPSGVPSLPNSCCDERAQPSAAIDLRDIQPGRVSVIIPTFNRATLVPRAIESVLAQSAVDQCDIVVVDDGGRDNTAAVVARYGAHVRYMRQDNAGLAAARNTGIRASRGEFVAFVDDDDEWLPDKVRLQLDAFARWPQALLVAGCAYDRDAAGLVTPRSVPPVPLDSPVDLAPALFAENVLIMPTVILRRRVLQQAGLFWEALRRVEDHHLWTRVACYGPGVCLSAPLAIYAVASPDALSRNRAAMLQARRVVYADLRRMLRRRPDCRAAWRRGRANCLARLRDLAFSERRYADAAGLAARTLTTDLLARGRWEWGILARALLYTLRPPPHEPPSVVHEMNPLNVELSPPGRVTSPAHPVGGWEETLAPRVPAAWPARPGCAAAATSDATSPPAP